MPGVKAAAPFIESRGLLANGRRVAGAVVRGVLPEEEAKAVGLGSAAEIRFPCTICRPASTA